MPMRPRVPIVGFVAAREALEKSAHSASGLCFAVGFCPVTIEHVQQVVEHDGDSSTRTWTQQFPAPSYGMSQSLTGEKGLATTTGVGSNMN